MAFRAAVNGYYKIWVETRKQQPTSKTHVICLEVKISEKWDRRWEKPMRSLDNSGLIHVDKMIGIYTGKRVYHFDGIDVLPLKIFLKNFTRVIFFSENEKLKAERGIGFDQAI